MVRWVATALGLAAGAAALTVGAPDAASRDIVPSMADARTSAPQPLSILPAEPAAAVNPTIEPVGAALADPQTERLLTIARRELDRLGSQIARRDRVGIVDFSKPSSEPRLFLVDLERDTVAAYRVTHGKGSDPFHTGRLQTFSALDGSEATSRGAFRTAELYVGQHGRSMRLDGLDPDNSTARARAIVLHAAAYAEPSMVAARGKLGRSQGCFAVASADLTPVIDFLGQGRLLFADRL